MGLEVQATLQSLPNITLHVVLRVQQHRQVRYMRAPEHSEFVGMLFLNTKMNPRLKRIGVLVQENLNADHNNVESNIDTSCHGYACTRRLSPKLVLRYH